MTVILSFTICVQCSKLYLVINTEEKGEKMIDIMWENDKLKHEVSKLKETLNKAYDYMKQFVIDGRNLLDRFKEILGKATERVRDEWFPRR